MSKKSKGNSDNTIALNRKARHEYTIQETIEAGIELKGWEVKSLREGKGNLTESYAVIKNGEVWLLGAHFTPLTTASTHVKADPTRTRKLLLHRREIDKLFGLINQKGFTLVPLSLYWKKNNIKLSLGLVKGKKQHDKRAAEKEKDSKRELSRALKQNY